MTYANSITVDWINLFIFPMAYHADLMELLILVK